MDIHILLIVCLLKFTVVTIDTTCNDTEHNQYLFYFLHCVLDCLSLRVCVWVHACTCTIHSKSLKWKIFWISVHIQYVHVVCLTCF